MAHFYESIPAEIRGLSHADAVARYAAGAGVPASSIAGLTGAQLGAFPVPGTWSIRQIVVHLMDTDLIASYRMKRIIAEDSPRLDAYDENAFVKRLGYERLDIRNVCDVFRLNRLVTAEMLGGLPDAAFDRVADHPEVGALTLGQLLRLYVNHLDHHVKFIEKKRGMVS